MKRPALLLALLAVLTAPLPVYPDYKADLATLPATLDPTGCPNGDQSKPQERGEAIQRKEMNKVECPAGMGWGECIMRKQRGR